MVKEGKENTHAEKIDKIEGNSSRNELSFTISLNEISDVAENSNNSNSQQRLSDTKLESSSIDSIILGNEHIDARSSIDFGAQKNHQDPYIAMTLYEPSSYKKRKDSFPQNDEKSKSVDNHNMPTKRSISEIDVRRDDHLSKLKETMPQHEPNLHKQKNEHFPLQYDPNSKSVDNPNMRSGSEIDVKCDDNLTKLKETLTQYEPNLYKKRNDSFPSQNDSNSKSVDNKNMPTAGFMSEIDIRCHDHLLKFKENLKADRFCSECRVLCCDSCVIDYHTDHIKSARIKVEDYFKIQKLEIEELRSKINSLIKCKNTFSEFNLTMEILEKNINTYFSRRKNSIENLKSNLETLLIEENDLSEKMKETLHVFYKDEALKRMNKPIKDLDHLQNRLQNFLRDLEGFSSTDKARAQKSNQISQFRDEANELNLIIEDSVNVFRNKSKVVEKNINDILISFFVNEKLSKIQLDINEISENIKSSAAQVNKINFDEKSKEEINITSIKPEEIKFTNFRISSTNDFLLKKNNSDDFQLIKDDREETFPTSCLETKNINVNLAKINEMEVKENTLLPGSEKAKTQEGNILDNTNKISINKSESLNQSSKSILSINSQNQIRDNFTQQNNQYDIMIGLKSKSDNIVLFDAQKGFFTIKLNKSFFQDQSNTFTAFPENSRFVNLGFSLLITGGYLNGERTTCCYLLVATGNNNPKSPYDISIMPYSNMLEARERHNLIYLPEMNSVLACSGFFTQNTEICDLNTSTWRQCSKMNEMRANGTIAYVNKRYVWIFSGFSLNETRQQGIYSNSAEVLDLKSQNKAWTLFNFDNLKIPMKLCAMGVINISHNSIILCGGFDGNKYHTTVNRIEMNEGTITAIQTLSTQLPSNMIFLHNNFMRLYDTVYNYDLNMNAVSFDLAGFSFKASSYGSNS